MKMRKMKNSNRNVNTVWLPKFALTRYRKSRAAISVAKMAAR